MSIFRSSGKYPFVINLLKNDNVADSTSADTFKYFWRRLSTSVAFWGFNLFIVVVYSCYFRINCALLKDIQTISRINKASQEIQIPSHKTTQCGQTLKRGNFMTCNTIEPRYLELAYFELPLISK